MRIKHVKWSVPVQEGALGDVPLHEGQGRGGGRRGREGEEGQGGGGGGEVGREGEEGQGRGGGGGVGEGSSLPTHLVTS